MPSPEALRLAEEYRQLQVQIRAGFIREYSALWPLLDTEDVAGTSAAWLALVLPLVRRWQGVSSSAANTYWSQVVQLETGTTADVAAAIAAVDMRTVLHATLFPAVAVLRRAARRGLAPLDANRKALAVSSADAALLAGEPGRTQLEEQVRSDRRAQGWMRVTDGEPCAFCAMLAARGPVYKTAQTAGFVADPVRGEINRYHPNCGCQVVPVFSRDAQLPETSQFYKDLWTKAQRDARVAGELNRGTSNDALNAFRRAVEGRREAKVDV